MMNSTVHKSLQAVKMKTQRKIIICIDNNCIKETFIKNLLFLPSPLDSLTKNRFYFLKIIKNSQSNK